MNEKLPIVLKVVIGYFLLNGGIGLLWPVLGFGPHHPEFEVMSTAYKIGVYFRESVINILFVVSGVALLFRKRWGRKLGLVTIVISFIYAGNAYAWGLMGGEPTWKAYLFSYAIVGIWSMIWFYLLLKKSSKEALKNDSRNVSIESS